MRHMAEDLKINVFIADEKYAILIPRNENQSDEEEIIRRSAKRVEDAVREIEQYQPGISKVNSLAMVALRLAVNLNKNTDSRRADDSAVENALSALEESLKDELRLINEQQG